MSLTQTNPVPPRNGQQELKNRGVQGVLIACYDGLKGLPQAITATWPQAASVAPDWSPSAGTYELRILALA
jgi:hypothetical protein